MNSDIQTVINLYKEQVEAYEKQAEDLKQRYRECDNKNAALIGKVQELESLIEKAKVAYGDINSAFEHVHQENIRLTQGADSNKQLQIVETDTKKDQLASESLVWLSERDQFKQRTKFLERECERYHRDNVHMGKQIRHLLKTLEEERGMIVRHQSPVTPDDDQVTCAADVIDRHLITFGSIEELQQQNQKLLSLVKNLSAEQEERELRVESEQVQVLTADLDELKSQLETIKSDRDRIINALTTIHRERDLFKILLCKTRQVEHLTPEIFQRMVAVACSSGPAIADSQASSTEREAHIEDLKKVIKSLEHDLSTVKHQLEELRATSAADLTLKNELLEKAHIKISEIMKSQEAMVERNQLLESNILGLTKEFDEIRTKCQKMTFELEEANQKREDAEGLNQELKTSLEVERNRCQDAMIELSQARTQSEQLSENLEREKQARQQELASIFNDIQERQMREFEERTKKQVELEVKLSNSERDMQSLRSQLEDAIREKGKIADLNCKLSQPTRDLAAEARIRDLESQLANQPDITAAEARIRDLEFQLANRPNTAAAESHIRDLESQPANQPDISAAEARIRDLESQLANRPDITAAEAKIKELETYLVIMQGQRNRERDARLKLDRLINGCPRKEISEEQPVIEVPQVEPTQQEPPIENQPSVTQIKLKRRKFT